MKPEFKTIIANAAALIEASRDELRDRCAATTGQKLEAAAVELRSIVADAQAAPEQPAAAPAPAPAAPLDLTALAAELAPLVAAQVLAAIQPAAPVEQPAA